jgi:hypothetical protein
MLDVVWHVKHNLIFTDQKDWHQGAESIVLMPLEMGKALKIKEIK